MTPEELRKDLSDVLWLTRGKHFDSLVSVWEEVIATIPEIFVEIWKLQERAKEISIEAPWRDNCTAYFNWDMPWIVHNCNAK